MTKRKWGWGARALEVELPFRRKKESPKNSTAAVLCLSSKARLVKTCK